MTLIYLIILLAPVILHSKGNPAVLVFLSMNSIIYFLMRYTRIQIRAITRFGSHGDKAKELIDQGGNFDEAMEDLLDKVDLEEEIHLPKLIEYAYNISRVISLLAIIVGIGKVIGNII